MSPISVFRVSRRAMFVALTAFAMSSAPVLAGSAFAQAPAAADPPPSWNNGPAKQASWTL